MLPVSFVIAVREQQHSRKTRKKIEYVHLNKALLDKQKGKQKALRVKDEKKKKNKTGHGSNRQKS